MILEYEFTDNILTKKDPTSYPNHLQGNITLQFVKLDESLPNTRYYADIKNTDSVKRVKLEKNNDMYCCELPLWVTNYTFFKLSVHSVVEDKHFTTNELVIPVRVSDYMGYDRLMAHTHKKIKSDKCYEFKY